MPKKLSIVEILEFQRDSQLKAISESTFKNAVIDMAEESGWRVCHILPAQIRPGKFITPYQGKRAKGFPDLWLLRPPRFLVWELKKMSGTTSPEQLEWMGELAQIPGIETGIFKPSDSFRIIELLK